MTAQVMMTLPRSGILFLPALLPRIKAEFAPEVVRPFCGRKSGATGSAINHCGGETFGKDCATNRSKRSIGSFRQ